MSLYARLTLAVMRGDAATVAKCLDEGASVEGSGKRGATQPLAEAVSFGQEAVVRLLLERGADASARGEDDVTPLHLAASRKSAAIVRMLIAAGADVHAQTKEWGFTPLIDAALDGRAENVQLLLDADADPNVRTRNGRSALGFARENKRTKVVALLQALGAVDDDIPASPATLGWPKPTDAERFATPENTLFCFLRDMNRVELRFRSPDEFEEQSVAAQAVYDLYLAPRNRPALMAVGSISDPPHYDPARQSLTSSTLESPSKAILITLDSYMDFEYRYTVIRNNGRWWVDGCKFRGVHGETWTPHLL